MADGKSQGNKDRRFHIGTASDGCFTSHMKSDKFARLTQFDTQDPHGSREDDARTAEITISKILKGLCSGIQVVEDKVHGVISRVWNVLLMVVHHDIRIELNHENDAVGFEVQERHFCRHCKLARRTHPARCPASQTMYQVAVFPIATTTHACLCQWSLRNTQAQHFDENLTLAGVGGDISR